MIESIEIYPRNRHHFKFAMIKINNKSSQIIHNEVRTDNQLSTCCVNDNGPQN